MKTFRCCPRMESFGQSGLFCLFQIAFSFLFGIFAKKRVGMQKIIALDFGLKRTGIAITDAMQIIASGLTTVETSDLLSYLQQLFSQEQIELVVVGLPKQMDNSFSESETHIQAFLKKFAKQFPTISITRIDERFTSKMASAAMVASGMKKKKRQEKGMVDQISATIILQTYLDAK